jgi:hypothetical protein
MIILALIVLANVVLFAAVMRGSEISQIEDLGNGSG